MGAKQWAANVRFLERTVARGDEVFLSNPARPGTTLFKEVEYLQAKGYTYVDSIRLVLVR